MSQSTNQSSNSMSYSHPLSTLCTNVDVSNKTQRAHGHIFAWVASIAAQADLNIEHLRHRELNKRIDNQSKIIVPSGCATYDAPLLLNKSNQHKQ